MQQTLALLFDFQYSVNKWIEVSLNFGVENHVFHWVCSWGIWVCSPLMIFSMHYLTLVSPCGWCPGPKAINSGTQYFDCCSVKYMCSAHSQLCQTPSKICISSCMDISIARSLLLHFQCWFPVSLKNLARFWVFGFSFGFISCRPHSKNAYHGHCFHFLSCVDIPSIK